MAGEETMRERSGANPWRIAGWSIAALILLLPLIAMRFTSEVNWTAGDFIFAALLMGIVGVALELTVRMTRSSAHRAGVAAALATAFLTVWINGAVGMIGDEDNPYNLLFLAVILLALAGSVLARFRPGGMAAAMTVAAGAQAALGVFGMLTDLRGGILASMFAALWLLAAWQFRRGARAS